MTSRSETLTFELSQKEILNSNSIPNHFIVKGNMVANLRTKAAQAGLLLHPEAEREVAQQKLDLLRLEQETIVRKNRLRKRLKKDSSLSEAQVEAAVEEQFPGDEELLKSSDLKIKPLFGTFKVRVRVFPPTRRRLDPPNLYPTLKALTDGLTDVGWWEDDDFMHLLEVSFVYGGLSGLKGTWKIALEFEAVDDTTSYVLVSEVQ